LRAGQPVLLADDDRENEADFIVAASELTEPVMALLIRECSGIVCLYLSHETVAQLRSTSMVSRNEYRYGTYFTVSTNAYCGATTGVNALSPHRFNDADVHAGRFQGPIGA
jgi:3,4-dihydroxy 2-butanone 4-phosphate synthase